MLSGDEKKENPKINIEKLTRKLCISDSDLDPFISYLNEIWLDLYSRVIDNKNDLKKENPKELNGLTKIVFADYYNMPGLIGARLFSAFDSKRNGSIGLFEFITNMKILFYENYEKNSRFIFDFYDFDYDGKITKEDIRVVLSYITLSHTENIKDINGDNRLASQKELFNMINKSFGENEIIDYIQFKNIVENVNSDIYLSVFLFLLENKPFSLSNLEPFRKKNSEVKTLRRKSINSVKYLACPTRNANFKLYKRSSYFEKSRKNAVEMSENVSNDVNKIKNKIKGSSIFKSKKRLETEINNVDDITLFNSSKNVKIFNVRNKTHEKNCIIIAKRSNKNIKQEEYKSNNSKKKSKGILSKKGGILNKILLPIKSSFNIAVLNMRKKKTCNNFENIIENPKKNENPEIHENDQARFIIENVELCENSSDSSSSDITEEIFEDLSNTNTDIFFEGKLCKSNNNKIKELWFKLINKDLYYYKNKNDEKYSGMHNLSGNLFKEEPITEFDGKKYFSFSLELPSKKRTYYCDNESDYKNWVNKLKKILNYKDIFEKYEIKEKIGNGRYGLIKLATNKKTGENFAVKIMSKKEMNSTDLELVRNEIEILKICQHPYIIKFIEHFENTNYIFIIMEYCKGGDLIQYYKKKNFNISEQRISEIMHQLCLAIKYIHSYGVAHRDLKLDNILLIEDNENSTIRLCDFGFSKIVGPSEKCDEPYGSLCYTAPEIIDHLPYNKQVDLWSIGIINYILCCGKFPFYDKDTNKLMDKIVENDIDFDFENFNNYSKEMKDFIYKLLKKEPEKRMNVVEALKHSWFKKMNKKSKNFNILN